MKLTHPYSYGVVEVPDGLVARYKEAGFKEQEPEVVETSETVPAPRKRRARKDES